MVMGRSRYKECDQGGQKTHGLVVLKLPVSNSFSFNPLSWRRKVEDVSTYSDNEEGGELSIQMPI